MVTRGAASAIVVRAAAAAPFIRLWGQLLTELRLETYTIPAADLGPENPLPVFRGRSEHARVVVDDSVPEDERRWLGQWTQPLVLPHRMQDGYNRARKPRDFSSIVLENEFVRATFLPELGGRLASLVHKPLERELLARNPVWQPANLGLRNAWFAGGIEWNTCVTGHYHLTCSPIFAARLESPGGYPVLRLYEWDRVRCFPWQIDFHLPPGSRFLFSRVRIVNPHERVLPMYWWTNMGVLEAEDVRVIAPADSAITGGANGLTVKNLPCPDGRDLTYTTNAGAAGELFMRIPEGHRRWIAAVDGEGRGFVQTSTDRLAGRKLFYFGMGQGGRRWQNYLGGPGWQYLEIQAGLARTQMECLPMPPLAEWSWTEAFGYLEAPADAVHGPDWARARLAVERQVEQALPRAEVERLDAVFAGSADTAPAEELFTGSGWGALERRRLLAAGEPDRIPAALPFPEASLGAPEAPWLSLLEKGVFPERDPEEGPGHYLVQTEWRGLLTAAARKAENDHWLSWLHLGVMRREAGDRAGAKRAWERSVEHRRTGWALRNLARLSGRRHKLAGCCDMLLEAWNTGPQAAALAIECGLSLLQAERYSELREFAAGLPPGIGSHERIRIMAARAALEMGELDELEDMLGQEFTSVREGEVLLTDLWFSLHERRIARDEQIPVDDALRERVRREFPPPANIDFRMS